jgi:hypothetical protein
VDSEELEDSAGSREVFDVRFWQPDGVSESLQGLGFAKAVQWFICRGTTSTTDKGDISRPIATDHSSDGWLPSSARWYCDPCIYSTIMK